MGFGISAGFQKHETVCEVRWIIATVLASINFFGLSPFVFWCEQGFPGNVGFFF